MPLLAPAPCFVGVDVAKATIAAAITGQKSRTFIHTPDGLQALVAWVRRNCPKGELRFVAESSGVYSRYFAFHLQHLPEITVAIVDPARVRYSAKSRGVFTKTDHVDAQVILDYALHVKPAPYLHPTQVQAELSSLHHELKCVERDLRRISNRLEALAFLPQAHQTVKESLERQQQALQAERQVLEQAVKKLYAGDAELHVQHDLLRTIPSFGPVVTRLLLSLGRALFTLSPKQLVQYAGLAPAHRESGSSVHGKSMITRRGHAGLRQALYMCALSAAKCHPLFREDYKRWREAGKPGKLALIAVARKLLLLAQSVLVSGKPFDPARGCPQA